jgi:hypothetical protein
MKKAAVPSILVAVVLLALVVIAEAQQPGGNILRIGYVSTSGDPNNPGSQIAAFRQGLRDLSYIFWGGS